MKCRTEMKKQNILEDKMLTRINEASALLTVLKWFMRPVVKRALKNLKDDPEWQAAEADLIAAADRARDLKKRFEKKYGRSPW